MNKIVDWGKRYFLAVAPAPFVIGCLLAMGLGMFGGWLLLRFKPAWHTGVVVVSIIVGLGLLIGGINKLICRLFVSHSNKLGAFFAYRKITPSIFASDGSVQRGLIALGNPLWFWKGQRGVEIRWLGLPSTEGTHEIDLEFGPFTVLLEVVFNGGFDLEKVFSVIVWGTEYKSFDDWLKARFSYAAQMCPAVRELLKKSQPTALSLNSAVLTCREAMKVHGFSASVLGNIDYIRMTPTVTADSVRFG